MDEIQPIYDPSTHYLIEVKGWIDADWLENFDATAEISVREVREAEYITTLQVHTDQAGIIGLVRKLHRLGSPILQLQIIPNRREGA